MKASSFTITEEIIIIIFTLKIKLESIKILNKNVLNLIVLSDCIQSRKLPILKEENEMESLFKNLLREVMYEIWTVYMKSRFN